MCARGLLQRLQQLRQLQDLQVLCGLQEWLEVGIYQLIHRRTIVDNNKNYRIIEEGWTVYKVVGDWVIDTNGNNYASVERWGSESAAIESLKTLKNCFSCVDCWYWLQSLDGCI